jgi:hypothetical protein
MDTFPKYEGLLASLVPRDSTSEVRSAPDPSLDQQLSQN